MTIGDKIKSRRNELKWTQRELAAKMGYSNHSTIVRIEAGKVDIPQSKIVKFAEVLGLSVADLMGWVEKPQEAAELHFEMIMDEDLTEIFADFKKLDATKRKIVKDLVHNLAEA